MRSGKPRDTVKPKLESMKLTLGLQKLERVRRILGARSSSEAVRMVVRRELEFLEEMKGYRPLKKMPRAFDLRKLT